MKLYPAIDVAGGRCVRLEQGRFDRSTVVSSDPVATAASFASQGATALHLVDLDAARDPTARQLGLVESVARTTPLALQVGGGVRGAADVTALLETGATRVVVGSLAVREPEVASELLARFGAERLVFALDVRLDESGTPRLVTSAWRETERLTLWEALAHWQAAGLRTVLCTDVGRDGMLTGPSLELYRGIRSRHPALELLASGGIASLGDLRSVRELGAAGAVVGKALYEGRFTLAEALTC